MKKRIVYKTIDNTPRTETEKRLAQQIRELKLKRELASLRDITVKPKNENDIIRHEISEYEKKRNQIKTKGFRGFFEKAQLNRQINERNAILRRQASLKNIKIENELAQERAKLNQARAKSNIELGNLGSDGIKRLKIEDLY